jgi:hypothetical protein
MKRYRYDEVPRRRGILEIAGSRRDVNEIWGLFGFYAA